MNITIDVKHGAGKRLLALAGGIAVIGGVVTSTFLTLVVVPIVYTWMDRFTLRNRSAATRDPFREEAAEAADDGPAPLRAAGGEKA